MTFVRKAAESALAAAFALFVSWPSPLAAASARPATGARGMVVAPEPQAAAIGVAVLKGGGNAVDAAVAVALALSVSYPRAGSLGGGGFLLYRAPDGTHFALDFREVAPQALNPEAFRGAGGAIDPEKSREGGLAVGVPGLVAGLAAIHERFGRRPWAELVAPAVELAERGVIVTRLSAEIFSEEKARLAADPAARLLFTHDGAPLAEGDRLVQKDLARTLRGVAKDGGRAVYGGDVAAAIVSAVRGAGGVMSAGDLAAYHPVERKPLEGTYRGLRVVGFPPPSSGGIVLLQILAMLERFDMKASGPGSSLTLHRIAEAERRAFADRGRFLGDPDFVDVPVRRLLDPRYLASRAATIRDDRASPSDEVRPGLVSRSEGTDTLQLSVADPRGGAVALTTTLNSWFGAAIVAPGTGILLNNEMDDFSLARGVANQYGLVGEDANAPAGRKRPLSSMCPTIVEDVPPGPRPRLVLGARGGPMIISSVLQTLLHVVDDGMTLQEAVDAPRVHQQWIPDTLVHEPLLPADVLRALLARGQVLGRRDVIGEVEAIGIDAAGRWTGAADPRGEGMAQGY
jgi:gamma-glutamyltranspeptidase / glutathione hydrolase